MEFNKLNSYFLRLFFSSSLKPLRSVSTIPVSLFGVTNKQKSKSQIMLYLSVVIYCV